MTGGYIAEEFQEMKLSTIESIKSKLAKLFGKYTKEAEIQLGYLTHGRDSKESSFCWNVMMMSSKCTKNIKDKEALIFG